MFWIQMIISYSLFAPCEVLWTLTRAEGAAGWPRVVDRLFVVS